MTDEGRLSRTSLWCWRAEHLVALSTTALPQDLERHAKDARRKGSMNLDISS